MKTNFAALEEKNRKQALDGIAIVEEVVIQLVVEAVVVVILVVVVVVQVGHRMVGVHRQVYHVQNDEG
jgi:hypothetical protein